MNSYRKRTSNNWNIQCGCVFLLFVFNIFVGGWSVNWLLDFFYNKTIPFVYASLIGLFVGEFSVPIAIVMSILEKFGVIG